MNKNERNTQKKFYNENGFIKVKNFFTKREIKILKNLVESIEQMKPEKGKQMIYQDSYNKKSFLTRTENFYDYHRGMKKFLNKKKILNLLSNLVGSKPILFKDKINWKYPGGKGFEPHQDGQVWQSLYKNIRSFISFTISIDKTNEKNGCLEIVRKKHKQGLLGTKSSAISKKIVSKLKWEKLKTKPGDVILFGAYTPHRSGPNKTKKARRMMYLTYNAKKDGDLRKEYFKNKRISYPPNFERIEGKKYKYLI
tara:strand:+ start:118 stop:876 length:759 start_codon:yes stop_codon:yes gene_type:complete